jgi:PAS domain S-box-containing protein
MFDFISDGLLVTDLGGKISDANVSACALLGIPPLLIEGRQLISFVLLTDRAAISTMIDRIPSTGVIEWEARMKPHAGKPFSASLSAAVACDAQGVPIGIRWLIREIAEPASSIIDRPAPQAVREMDAAAGGISPCEFERASDDGTYRSLVEAAQDIISRHDSQGRFSYASPSCHTLLGYAADEMRHFSLFDLAHPADRTELQRLFCLILDAGGSGRLEFRLQQRDHRYRWIEIVARGEAPPNVLPRRGIVTAVMRDMTHRSRAAARMRQDYEEKLSIFEHTTEAVIALDDGWTVTYANACAEQCCGVRREELLGQSLRQIAPDMNDTLFGGELRKAMEGRSRAAFEMFYPPLGGWIAVRAYPLDGGIAVYIQKVANRKRAEQEVAWLLRDLREASDRHQELLTRLVNTQEEERQTIAYDLHDGLAQYITAAESRLKSFQERLPCPAADTLSLGDDFDILAASECLRHASTEVRRLVGGLGSLALEDHGLDGALARLLSEEQQRAGWEGGKFDENVTGLRFEPVAEATIYRVTQEALTNARRHARTPTVALRLTMTECPRTSAVCRLTLEIQDWGVGFEQEEICGRETTLGLHGMRERTRRIGAQFSLETARGHGTVIRAIFPKVAILRGGQ